MYRWIKEKDLPKWLKILINVLITITIIYWLGFIIYKSLDMLRIFLHTVSETKIWWTSLVIIIACTITTLCILECFTNVKPFTSCKDSIITWWNCVRNKIANIIGS